MNAKLAVVSGAMLVCVAAHAATRDDYAYAWPLQTEGDAAAWQVELNPEVYAAVTRADLRDIEVINAAGESVPMAPRVQGVSVARESITALPLFVLPATRATQANDADAIRLHFERGADGRLRSLDADIGGPDKPAAAGSATTAIDRRDVLLDASAIHEPLAGLRIDWSDDGRNVTAQFAVSASDDLQQWRSLVAGASVLHLVQDGNILDRHEVALNHTRAAYLRLHRLDDGAVLGGVVVQARTLAQSTIAQPARRWLPASLAGNDTRHVDPSMPAADGATPIAYRYRLPAPLAVEALRVELADDNSLARVSVASHDRGDPANPTTWTPRASLVAFRLHQGDAVVGNDDVGTNYANRASDWRIELATPLTHAPALSVAYRPDRFVFLAQGAGPYRLVAGSARAYRADYPLDAALAPLRAKLGNDWQPPLANLGPRATLQGERALTALPPPEKQHDWRTWLLWAVLIGAAMLIGGLALSLLRAPKA